MKRLTLIAFTVLLITAAQAAKMLPVPDLNHYAYKYNDMFIGLVNSSDNNAQRYVIAQDGGRYYSQQPLVIHGYPLESTNTSNLVRDAGYLKAGSCLANGELSARSKSFRNKCRLCKGWTLLEAFEFNSSIPFVDYAWLGYNPTNQQYVVGVWGDMNVAEFQHLMYDIELELEHKPDIAMGSISPLYYDTFTKVKSTLAHSMKSYIRPVGQFAKKHIKFVGYGTASPVAELLAWDQINNNNPRRAFEVSVLTAGMPAYGDLDYEKWVKASFQNSTTRLISTANPLSFVHRPPFARLSIGEILTHSQQHKVGIWWVTDHNAHPWNVPGNEPMLLEVIRGHHPSTYVCEPGGCLESYQLDIAEIPSLMINYAVPLDCQFAFAD